MFETREPGAARLGEDEKGIRLVDTPGWPSNAGTD
jgi:hypothetical protein